MSASTYIKEEKDTPQVEEDTSTQLHTDFQQRYITAICERLSNIHNIIPIELRNKYCLLFGNHVLVHADTYSDILIQQSNMHGLDTQIYIPPIVTSNSK